MRERGGGPQDPNGAGVTADDWVEDVPLSTRSARQPDRNILQGGAERKNKQHVEQSVRLCLSFKAFALKMIPRGSR